MMSPQKVRLPAWNSLRWFFPVLAIIALGLMLKRPAAVAEATPPSLTRAHNEQFQAKWTDLEQAHQRGEKAEARFTAEEINSALEYPGQPGQVTFSGDSVTGQFVANIHGPDVYVTISGKLGTANGYVTFQPASLKIGDMPVPVAILRAPLQSKLAEPETHARLKLPDYIADLRVEDGQLIVVQK
jgi:hypothetical protein